MKPPWFEFVTLYVSENITEHFCGVARAAQCIMLLNQATEIVENHCHIWSATMFMLVVLYMFPRKTKNKTPQHIVHAAISYPRKQHTFMTCLISHSLTSGIATIIIIYCNYIIIIYNYCNSLHMSVALMLWLTKCTFNFVQVDTIGSSYLYKFQAEEVKDLLKQPLQKLY